MHVIVGFLLFFFSVRAQFTKKKLLMQKKPSGVYAKKTRNVYCHLLDVTIIQSFNDKRHAITSILSYYLRLYIITVCFVRAAFNFSIRMERQIAVGKSSFNQYAWINTKFHVPNFNWIITLQWCQFIGFSFKFLNDHNNFPFDICVVTRPWPWPSQ